MRLWHDLALALGGRTVTELQASMSATEFARWVAYVEEKGPLDYQRRYDEPAALIAWAVQASQGGKAKIDQFLRYHPHSNLSALDNEIAIILGVGR